MMDSYVDKDDNLVIYEKKEDAVKNYILNSTNLLKEKYDMIGDLFMMNFELHVILYVDNNSYFSLVLYNIDKDIKVNTTIYHLTQKDINHSRYGGCNITSDKLYCILDRYNYNEHHIICYIYSINNMQLEHEFMFDPNKYTMLLDDYDKFISYNDYGHNNDYIYKFYITTIPELILNKNFNTDPIVIGSRIKFTRNEDHKHRYDFQKNGKPNKLFMTNNNRYIILFYQVHGIYCYIFDMILENMYTKNIYYMYLLYGGGIKTIEKINNAPYLVILTNPIQNNNTTSYYHVFHLNEKTLDPNDLLTLIGIYCYDYSKIYSHKSLGNRGHVTYQYANIKNTILYGVFGTEFYIYDINDDIKSNFKNKKRTFNNDLKSSIFYESIKMNTFQYSKSNNDQTVEDFYRYKFLNNKLVILKEEDNKKMCYIETYSYVNEPTLIRKIIPLYNTMHHMLKHSVSLDGNKIAVQYPYALHIYDTTDKSMIIKTKFDYNDSTNHIHLVLSINGSQMISVAEANKEYTKRVFITLALLILNTSSKMCNLKYIKGLLHYSNFPIMDRFDIFAKVFPEIDGDKLLYILNRIEFIEKLV